MRIDRIAQMLCGSWIALALAGCPGSLDNPELFRDGGVGAGGGGNAGPCGDVPTAIFAPKCGGTGCHGGVGPQQGLDLEAPGVAARVVGIPAKECTGILADPANPTGSILYTKLLSGGACGAQMPLARPVLPQAEIDCIKTWIQEQGGGSTGSGGSGGSTGSM
jgi:hypothetical protein